MEYLKTMTKNNLSFFTATVALAGFLFGFDTVVISGANLPIKELWHTTPLFHGTFIMSMALWGTVLGAILGSFPTNLWGRKKTLLMIGILFGLSALGTAFASGPYMFSFFRFIGGIGVGISSVAAPTYLSEISPADKRGQLVARYQFMIVFGILTAFISNYLLKGFAGGNDWRFMLGVMALPAIAYTIMVFFIPESPRWLVVKKNDDAGARNVLLQLGISNPDQAIREIRQTIHSESSGRIFQKAYSVPIILAFLIAFFNQLSGINFVLYYAPEILERAGLATRESLMSSVSIGLVNLVFTMLGMYLIDRLGRKTLLLWGSIGYIISLGMVAWSFWSGAGSALFLTFIMMFIASHAVGQGAVIWVFISEIFPNKVRAWGQSLGATTHWVFAALITLVTPVFLDAERGIFGKNPWPIFAFFAAFMVLQLLFVLILMPETKGKSLEQIEKELSKKTKN
jgi:sugar porter (SP) family MFS transporter